MKKCAICKNEFPISFFNKKSSSEDGLQSICKECSRAASRQYYAKNREKHIAAITLRVVKQKEEQRKIVRNIKESNPCTDCGKFYPYYVMDFDHLRDKENIISAMFGKVSTEKLLKEIEKCELVCANCHRIRTFTRVVQEITPP